MWTSTLNTDVKRVIATRLLKRFWRGVGYSSLSPLNVENLPRQPLPLATWVRVRNHLAGISQDDLRLIYGDKKWHTRLSPLAIDRSTLLGREVVGEVIEVGDDVEYIHVGDRVVLQYGPNCVSTGVETPCASCAAGNYSLCQLTRLPAPQIKPGRKAGEHAGNNGIGPYYLGEGWGEELLISEQQLFRLPSGVSDEQAVLLEPTAIALHAILRRIPRVDERVLIVGASTVGLLTLQLLRALAPQIEISILARHAFQVEQATRMGATHIIYPRDSYLGVHQATGARRYGHLPGNQVILGGYDVIYDTIGKSSTLHNALRWINPGATVVLVGNTPALMRLDLTPLWYQECNLIGALKHGTENWPPGSNHRRSTYGIASELITNGYIHPEQLITHRFVLNDYRQALETAIHQSRHRAIKVVFDNSLLPASIVPTIRAAGSSSHHLRPATNDPLLRAARLTSPLSPEPAAQLSAPLPATPQPTLPNDVYEPLAISEQNKQGNQGNHNDLTHINSHYPEDSHDIDITQYSSDALADTLDGIPAVVKRAAASPQPVAEPPASPAMPEIKDTAAPEPVENSEVSEHPEQDPLDELPATPNIPVDLEPQEIVEWASVGTPMESASDRVEQETETETALASEPIADTVSEPVSNAIETPVSDAVSEPEEQDEAPELKQDELPIELPEEDQPEIIEFSLEPFEEALPSTDEVSTEPAGQYEEYAPPVDEFPADLESQEVGERPASGQTRSRKRRRTTRGK